MTSKNGLKKTPKRVGRPRKNGQKGKIDPTNEILMIASELFSLKGFSGTTMAEIADLVGIRGPSLYYHFESKSEILRALGELGLNATIESHVKIRDEKSLSPAARIYKIIYDLISHLRSSNYKLNCLFDPAFQDKEFSDINARLTSWLRDMELIILDGVKQNQFAMDDPELTVYTVRGMIAISVRELANFKHITPEKMARYIADFTLTAMLRNKTMLKSIRKELADYNASLKNF